MVTVQRNSEPQRTAQSTSKAPIAAWKSWCTRAKDNGGPLRRNCRASVSDAIALGRRFTLPVFDPEILLRSRRSWCGGWCDSSSAPEIKGRIVPLVCWIVLVCSRITVGISEWICNGSHGAASPRGRQHAWLKCKVRLRQLRQWRTQRGAIDIKVLVVIANSTVEISVAGKSTVKHQTCCSVEGCVCSNRIQHGASIERVCSCICSWVSRVNSIIRLVTFARGRHGGDFGFGAGAGPLFSDIADCAQNQACKHEDESEDNDQLNESECVVMTAVAPASVGMISQAFDTNASTIARENFLRHSRFVISAKPLTFAPAD